MSDPGEATPPEGGPLAKLFQAPPPTPGRTPPGLWRLPSRSGGNRYFGSDVIGRVGPRGNCSPRGGTHGEIVSGGTPPPSPFGPRDPPSMRQKFQKLPRVGLVVRLGDLSLGEATAPERGPPTKILH